VKTNSQIGSSASGIGDVVLRTKYRVFNQGAAGAAVSLDLRLPTGDSDELLGTGATQAKVMFIGAASVADRLFPHVNFGYTFSSGQISDEATRVRHETSPLLGPGAHLPEQLAAINLDVPDELNYTFGADAVVHPRVTVAFDVIGRTLRDVERFALQTNAYEFRAGIPPSGTAAQVSTADREDFRVTKIGGNMNLLLGAIGAKFNIAGTLIFGANVLFPMSDNGLKPNVTPTISVDYAF
jgi:hypothetical protein